MIHRRRTKLLPLRLITFLVICTVLGSSAFAGEVVTPQNAVARWMIRGYQKTVSSSRGTYCPMYPHCSAYSNEAFLKHGFAQSLLMTCDRLLRCGADASMYQKVYHQGEYRWYDSEIPVGQSGLHLLSYPVNLNRHSKFSLASAEALQTSWNQTNGNLQSDTAMFLFASWLIEIDYYENAVEELHRLEFFYPQSLLIEEARVSLLSSLYRQEQFAELRKHADRYLSVTESRKYKIYIYYWLGLGNFRTGLYTKAISAFRSISRDEGLSRQELFDKARQLEAFSVAHLKKWTDAESLFLSTRTESKYLKKALYCAKLSRIGSKINRKDPTLAGFLGVVPGLGYLYDGYTKTALSSFLINGAFIWGAVEAYRKGNEGTGATLSIIGLGWYVGNIYGSISSAKRRNDKMDSDLLLKFDLGFSF